MFDNLREALREAIDNFKAEMYRDDLPEGAHGSMDRLLLGMRKEIADAKSALSTLDGQLVEVRAQVLQESTKEATCRRREKLARRVGDEETARIAAEYARRHARRHDMLERKIAVIEEEHSMRAAEIAEMLTRLRDVQDRRDALATARGDGNEGSVWTAEELLEELDRTAGAMDDAGHHSRARTIEELEDCIEREYADLRVDPWAHTEPARVDLDERLSELKRRMGRD